MAVDYSTLVDKEVVVRVSGFDELKRRLTALGNGKLARSMMRSGARKAAQVLAQGQRETVPVSSGRLRDSIGVQVKNANSDKLQVLVGPDKSQNYKGRFHEFGTAHMPGDHWMQRAFDQTSNDALEAYIKEVKRRLDVKTYKDLERSIEEGLSMKVDE